ncbi:GNAT family N-acetyltransferase [Amycolatopsis acidicola]|uniref:GNAT family N-acetyltransferase n=1 Tax=Amycolatopsis acidicola TaxID=2596893 RepID=A0A5N0V4E1_9PSEU|nr:GNAT family N-acetyltransferase [Amycolatopsis acidicola]KAA9160845.1 GNAT family N-acetyltransferase [Amycolatopsis acidicola]
MRIRRVTVADLPTLRDIERSAGAPFREIGMAAIADDEPPSIAELGRYQRAGRAWVSVDDADRPVAYLVAEPVDGNLHIEQLSVHADNARRGIGRTLLDRAADYARTNALPALTLTTFADVPWNAPYYERCGFHRLADDALTPGLREIREHETRVGLDRWPRLCMRKDLDR